MGMLLSLAWRSLLNRRVSVLLTILGIALSVTLFLGVEKGRKAAYQAFETTISGSDLIVGAPTGETNLLLYSVFRIGNATAEVSWASFKELEDRPDIAWAVPISLGDSHKGFRVLGTQLGYFKHYKYGQKQDLALSEGKLFDDLYDAVLGAEVASELGYTLGTEMILTHGMGNIAGLSDHDDKPFTVTGILERTGTPVDRTVHISVEGITAMHVGWETGARNPLADTITDEMIRGFDLTPKTVTAIYVGLERPGTIFRTKRAIDTNKSEPLLAIIPALALRNLWEIMGTAERILLAISGFVILVGLVSILTNLLTSLNERRREMSILRAIGARGHHIFALLTLEAGVLGLIGAAIGAGLTQILFLFGAPIVKQSYGIALSGTGLGPIDGLTILTVTGLALLLALPPAYVALKRSLADGLSVKL